jgi:prepilin-type N-terminal cleavage/methylation domain-containing protein
MIMRNYTKHNAFTMLELVFVIIVIGILAALTLPRVERDIKQEAGDNILSAIRYTQHLALTDNKQAFDIANWQQSLWMIRFEIYNGTEVIYKIGTDADRGGNIDKSESAIDPLTGKYLFTTDAVRDNDESPSIFLTQRYGINNVAFNNCQGAQATAAKHIAFDNKGRPHRGIINTTGVAGGGGAQNDFRTYVKNGQCEISFTSTSFDDTLKIIILEETGYAYIEGQPDS